jgi:hypothetical protein
MRVRTFRSGRLILLAVLGLHACSSSRQGGEVPDGLSTGGSGPGAGGGGTSSVAGGTTAQGGGEQGGAGTGGGTAGSAGKAGTANVGGSPSEPLGGFGQDTPGGRAGPVLKVTTLAAQGPGSLGEALAASGPRIIVFEVAGIIDLDQARLTVAEPFVTVAGETAPSPGITLIRGGLRITTHDVVLRHLRIRMGDAGAAAGSGFEPDVTTDGPSAYNVLFDHLSVSWGVDENLSVSGPRFDGPTGTSHHVTIRDSIIAEGLRNSVHEKGAHSMGTLVHDYCSDVAVLRNLYAHNDERNPWFKGFASGVIVNNVVYNPGKWAVRLGPVDSEWASLGITPDGPRVSVVGNYLRHGPNTPAGQVLVGTNSRGSAYLEDNLAFDGSGAPVAVASPALTVLAEKPAWPAGLVSHPAAAIVDWVVAHAGARPTDRDAVDMRIIDEFLAGGGGFVDSQDDVGGYPTAPAVGRALEVPTDDVEGWLATFAAELE